MTKHRSPAATAYRARRHAKRAAVRAQKAATLKRVADAAYHKGYVVFRNEEIFARQVKATGEVQRMLTDGSFVKVSAEVGKRFYIVPSI